MIRDEYIPQQFGAAISTVHIQVVHMGRLVENQIIFAIEAIAKADVALLIRTNASACRFHETESSISEMCYDIIANCRLTQEDLRELMSIIMAVAELRRIGNEAENILRLIHQAAQQSSLLMLPRFSYIEIKQSAAMAQDLLRKALGAFAHRDHQSASEVLQHDLENGFDASIHFLVNYMVENPRTIPSILEMLLVAMSIERITSHAMNLSKCVVYMSPKDSVIAGASEPEMQYCAAMVGKHAGCDV